MQQTRRRFDDLPPAQQAGILCNDDRFKRFAAIRCGYPGDRFTISAAARYLRDCCRIDSRAELNSNQTAQNRFQALRTEFDAWASQWAPK